MSISAAIFPSSAPSYPLVLEDMDQGPLKTKNHLFSTPHLNWLATQSIYVAVLPTSDGTIQTTHGYQIHIQFKFT